MADRIDDPEVWRPLTGMPDGAETWAFPGYREMTRRWLDAKARLKQDGPEGEFMREWLAERARAFAIETGQIEGLYTLKRGVTEQLIAEGFAGVVAAHTVESVADRTIRGLLEDQRTAYDMIFADVAGGRRLSQHMIKSWHQLLTRHQETVAGLTPAGERVEVEFRNKGVWKTKPNNPRRPDGVAHQYCPPEQVQSEMDRLLDLYAGIEARNHAAEVEAAWLHHRFVRTHPFQDGNGRVSRQLMAYVYVKRGLPPPLIMASDRDAYVDALEAANRGDLRRFSDYLAIRAMPTMDQAISSAQHVFEGRLSRPCGNGGRKVGARYYPPEKV